MKGDAHMSMSKQEVGALAAEVHARLAKLLGLPAR